MRETSARWTPLRVFWLITTVALVLPGIGMWWATGLVHDAVERRAAAGNAATAQAAAAQVERQWADRHDAAGNLLLLLANGAHLDRGLADVTRASSPFCRLSILDGAGDPLRTLPLPRCPAEAVAPGVLRADADTVTLAPTTTAAGDGIAGVAIRLNDVERRSLSSLGSAQWLQVRFPVSELMAPVQIGNRGTSTIVDAHTGVILSAARRATVGHQIAAPAARELVASGRSGVRELFAPNLRTRVLTAYEPIAGTPLGVFISLPTKEAYADATHLRNVLLAGFAMLLALGFTVAGVVAWQLARRDRSLRDKVDELRRLASTDSLTGLPNRAELINRLDTNLALVDRGELRGVAAIFLDLDGLKALNDGSGHAVADRLLVAVASAVSATLRPSDTIARYGGDEFILVAPGLADVVEARQLANRICRVIAGVRVVGDRGENVGVTASAGVAIATADSVPTSAAELVRLADQAMYRAKQRGGNAAEVTDGGVTDSGVIDRVPRQPMPSLHTVIR